MLELAMDAAILFGQKVYSAVVDSKKKKYETQQAEALELLSSLDAQLIEIKKQMDKLSLDLLEVLRKSSK